MRSQHVMLCLLGCAGLGFVFGCPGTTPGGVCAQVDEVCGADSACCEGLNCIDAICVAPPSGTQAAIPAKNIVLDLVGIHDPESGAYNGDCIGCHGDRTDEVALDGVTPAAHAIMRGVLGDAGNASCTGCHAPGPDFLTYSAGGLREQVNMQQRGCTLCHGAQSTIGPQLYAP